MKLSICLLAVLCMMKVSEGANTKFCPVCTTEDNCGATAAAGDNTPTTENCDLSTTPAQKCKTVITVSNKAITGVARTIDAACSATPAANVKALYEATTAGEVISCADCGADAANSPVGEFYVLCYECSDHNAADCKKPDSSTTTMKECNVATASPQLACEQTITYAAGVITAIERKCGTAACTASNEAERTDGVSKKCFRTNLGNGEENAAVATTTAGSGSGSGSAIIQAQVGLLVVGVIAALF